MDKRARIASLIEKRAAASKIVADLADLAKAETRKLSDTEQPTFDAAQTEVRELDARVAELDAEVRADDAAAEMAKRYAPSGVRVGAEPEVYNRSAGSPSYFRDMWLAQKQGDRGAIDRLTRNNAMRAEENRAINTTDGAGGEFVPPKWLVDEYVKLARPGRVTADRVPTSELPAGTDSISVPKVATGTATAQQTSQNTGVPQTDITTTSVSSPVVTLAGGQTLSLQLIEQSPLNVDDMVLGDLAAAYAVNLNTEVLSGSGAAGHIMGILTLSGTNAVTCGTADAKTVYTSVGGAISQVHGNRFLPPDAIVMHPRRWNWLLTQSDSQGRPLVVPNPQAPMNTFGTVGPIASEGYVGTMAGLPVYLDALIPTNVGAGTNQDRIIVARFADLRLYEGNVKAEAFAQTYANQLSVFVRLYNYASFQPARYPKSISVIDGVGLVAPAGF
jgi:HK97 family phage major capsid protein